MKRHPHPGLKGDGLTDEGEVLQRLLNEKPPLLELPAGLFKVGRTLRIHGGTRLLLHPQATLRLTDGAAREFGDYLLTNANHDTGDSEITVEGGCWDGNNVANPRGGPGLLAEGYSGTLLHFANVRNLRLSALRLHDAEAYYARFTKVTDFLIEDISFSAGHIRPNNDGIHLGGHCANGVIRRIRGLQRGVTGDDLVALNADDALQRTEVRGMMCGPIRDIRIEDLAAEDCHSFVRLLSVWSPIERIVINGVRGTCSVAALNCDAARGCRVPVFDERDPVHANGVGMLRQIKATDFHVAKSVENDIALVRLETRMSGFELVDFHRDLANDKNPQCPTLRLRHAGAASLTGVFERHVAKDEVFESAAAEIRYLGINAGR
ncbi:MAG: hypothetical protein LBH01_01485 [Verrucomicrobiales bacterium]|jgi:hypothetical protein|nr:hypothetical protein [Verrucomicrobiales bacterium]